MLGNVEVAVRDDRQAGVGDPGEQRLAVEELEAVDERSPALRVGGERRGAARARCGLVGKVRVGGDERGPAGASLAERGFEPVLDADERAQADCDGVTASGSDRLPRGSARGPG